MAVWLEEGTHSFFWTGDLLVMIPSMVAVVTIPVSNTTMV